MRILVTGGAGFIPFFYFPFKDNGIETNQTDRIHLLDREIMS